MTYYVVLHSDSHVIGWYRSRVLAEAIRDQFSTPASPLTVEERVREEDDNHATH